LLAQKQDLNRLAKGLEADFSTVLQGFEPKIVCPPELKRLSIIQVF